MMMDNPVIRSTWGDFKELSNVWTDEKIVLARPDAALTDATIAITSLGKNMTGFHPDLIILDDLVTDENYQSERALERCQILLQGCFPVLQKGGSLIVCGTRWSYSDIYGWLMDQDADAEAEERRQAEASHRAPRPIDKWKVYVRSVYNDDGSLFFPKVLSEGFLSSQKHNLRQQMMLFSSWYYNLPYEEGTKLFDTKSLIYFEAEYWRSPGNHLQFEDGTIVPLYVTMTIDPAPTVGPDSDFTGLSVVGTDYNGTWHVLWAEAIKKLPSRAADHVVALIIKFSPSIIAIETGQADPEFVDRIRTRLQEVGMNAPIVSYSANKDEVHGSRGKGQRIEALEPYFREGLVKLRRGIPLRDLLQQLDRYGAGLKHDDVIDALAMQRIYARPCREKTRQDLDSKLEQREEALSWGPHGPEVAARRVSPGAWIGRSSQYLR
jgi:predicted phage terminase large subunit-like protein